MTRIREEDYKHEAVSEKISNIYNFGCIVTAGVSFIVSEMTYNVSSGTLNTTIPYHLSRNNSNRQEVPMVNVIKMRLFCILLGSAVTFFRWSGQIYSRPVTWVIPKIERGTFFGHSVDIFTAAIAETKSNFKI